MISKNSTTAPLDAARSEFFEARDSEERRYWTAHYAAGLGSSLLGTENELSPIALAERLVAPQAFVRWVELQINADATDQRQAEVRSVLASELMRVAQRLEEHGKRPLPSTSEAASLHVLGKDFEPLIDWERARDAILATEDEPLEFCLREWSAIVDRARSTVRPDGFRVPWIFDRCVGGPLQGLGALRELVGRVRGGDVDPHKLRRVAASISAGDLVELCLRARVRLNEITDTIARVEARIAREAARVSEYEQAERRLGGSHHGAAR